MSFSCYCVYIYLPLTLPLPFRTEPPCLEVELLLVLLDLKESPLLLTLAPLGELVLALLIPSFLLEFILPLLIPSFLLVLELGLLLIPSFLLVLELGLLLIPSFLLEPSLPLLMFSFLGELVLPLPIPSFLLYPILPLLMPSFLPELGLLLPIPVFLLELGLLLLSIPPFGESFLPPRMGRLKLYPLPFTLCTCEPAMGRSPLMSPLMPPFHSGLLLA